MIDAHTLAQWNVIRLIQEIERQPAWGIDERIALYQAWLGAGAHDDAMAAHFNLAVLYHNAGRVVEAEAAYCAALALADLPQARMNLAALLEQNGRPQDALAAWQPLLSTSGFGAQALVASIRLARRLGKVRLLQLLLEQSLALVPDQLDVRAELAALRGDQLPAEALPKVDDAVIYVIAVCFNEARILPYFLDHYIKFLGAKKVFLHDGGSTDGTAEIAARYPEVELIVKVSEKLDDRELMAIRNEEWKKYRNECDWMIVCDVDELLYHPHLRTKLAQFKRDGVTLPMVEGYEMRCKVTPPYAPGRYLWEINQTGQPNPRYCNKNLIFDPTIDINYRLGCHNCDPTGPVKRSEEYDFKLLHYCMLSHEAVVEKSTRSAARLSDWNKQTNAGFHYKLFAAMPREEYNGWFAEANNAVAPRERPVSRLPVFDMLQHHVATLDRDAVIVELGSAPAFELGGDSGSTGQLAWYAHNYGAKLTTVEPDALLRRHVAYNLRLLGLGQNVEVVASAGQVDAAIDLLFCNATDYLGDDDDRYRCRQAAMAAFSAVEPHLKPGALVVLDGVGHAAFEGKFQDLVPLLQARGWMARWSGNTLVLAR